MKRETTQIEVTGAGVGLCSSLFVLFVVLKLAHVISWSWWWVFSPYWVPVGLVVVTIVVLLFIAAIFSSLR